MPGGLPRGGDMDGFGIDRYISVTEILAECKTTFTFIPALTSTFARNCFGFTSIFWWLNFHLLERGALKAWLMEGNDYEARQSSLF